MQLSFFSDEEERDKRLTVERTVDAIRTKHGKAALSLATAAYIRELGALPENDKNPTAVFKMHM